MKIIALSDLHGNLPELPSCDIVCICGDISPLMIQKDYIQMNTWIFGEFMDWINKLDCDKVFLTPGNHDFWFEKFCTKNFIDLFKYGKLEILIDEVRDYFVYEKDTFNTCQIRIYGTPWCKQFGNWAYMCNDLELEQIYANIPDNVDILLSHDAPIFMNNVGCILENDCNEDVGNFELYKAIKVAKPKYVFCGHIHSGNHHLLDYTESINEDTETGLPPEEILSVKIANVSLLDENYNVAYKPLIIDIMFTKYCENCEKYFESEVEMCPNCDATLIDTSDNDVVNEAEILGETPIELVEDNQITTEMSEAELDALIEEIKTFEEEDAVEQIIEEDTENSNA